MVFIGSIPLNTLRDRKEAERRVGAAHCLTVTLSRVEIKMIIFRLYCCNNKKSARGGFSRNKSGTRDSVRGARVRIERGFKN